MNGYAISLRLLPLAAVLLLAFGCTQPPQIKPRAPQVSPAQEQALRQAGELEATGDFSAAGQAFENLAGQIGFRRDELLLRAAEAYVRGGDPDHALELLARIRIQDLGNLQAQAATLLRARALLDLDRADEALAVLGPRAPAQTTADLQRRRLDLQATALLRSGNRLDSARALSELDLLLDNPEERLANQQRLLRTLGSLSDAVLVGMQPANDGLFSGWMELARSVRSFELHPEQADVLFANWRERNPTHPALPQLLTYYRTLQDRNLAELGRIAVLLPSSGRFAGAAGAVRDGLLSAYYGAEPRQRPELLFYDTSNSVDLWPLLQQARAEGAAAVIGPLQKSAVEQLIRAGDLPVPVLALNRVVLDTAPPAGLYQFGLAPEDEAIQAAEKVWADGALTAVALVPEGDWGWRLLDSFRRRFEQLGGRLLEQQTYDAGKHDFSEPIQALLNLDQSRARHKALVQTLGQKLEFEPQRPRAAGALFLAANAAKARQLWPQLQFHHIGDLPVYTTSDIHARRFSSPEDLDLVGLVFPEMPWLLREREGDAAPAPDGTLGRLYAMGMDSYRLLAALPRLQEFPGSRLPGATGWLRLDPLNRVHRRMPWARMTAQGPRDLGYLPEPGDAAEIPNAVSPTAPINGMPMRVPAAGQHATGG